MNEVFAIGADLVQTVEAVLAEVRIVESGDPEVGAQEDKGEEGNEAEQEAAQVDEKKEATEEVPKLGDIVEFKTKFVESGAPFTERSRNY